jgi:sortase (surface protein transpeptidase)
MEPLADKARSVAGGRHRSPWRAAGVLLVALSAITGSDMIIGTLTAEPVRPPQPAPAAAPVWLQQSASAPVGMTRSEPTEIDIPRIGVSAEIMGLGVDAEGVLQTPPLEQAQLAGWYQNGPSPGEIGNGVVVGHVDSRAMGPAVFFKLGELRAGDVIEIKRKDASVAKFVVDGTASYPKSAFPTDLVYGPSDQAGLRLITCGGEFDRAARSYLNNIIVFARLVPARQETTTPAAPAP